MPMNEAVGNMYYFLNDWPEPGTNKGCTINFVKGECPHKCLYCFMIDLYKRIGKEQTSICLDERELLTDLNKCKGKTGPFFIFVGSSTDPWAQSVPDYWRKRFLKRCCEFPENKYLFQTKNPEMFKHYEGYFPPKTILGTTLETNRDHELSKAPQPKDRAMALASMEKFERMVSVEPIIDFDLDEFVEMVKSVKPSFVSIGADSKNHGLPEPAKEKILKLAEELSKFTEVRIKSNLSRLTK